MKILHISDLHFGSKVLFDRQEVQSAFLQLAEKLTGTIDAVCVTGDIANSGRTSEYALASHFLDKLADAIGLERGKFVICPGNHDVDRGSVKYLSSLNPTLESSDEYFDNKIDCIHITNGQKAFSNFYETFTGRTLNKQTSITKSIEIYDKEVSIEFYELNTVIFSSGDADFGNLFVGRPSLNSIPALGDALNKRRYLIGHHPLGWISEVEESRVRALINDRFDVYMHGHIHKGEVLQRSGTLGKITEFVSGAIYQGQGRSITAHTYETEKDTIEVTRYTYSDDPRPTWIKDMSLCPDELDGRLRVTLNGPIIASDNAKTPEHIGSTGVFEFADPALFSNDGGAAIYVRPRISDRPFGVAIPGDDAPKTIDLDHLIQRGGAIQIEVPLEYGGTTVAKYICQKINTNSTESCIVVRADDIPSYEPKFSKYISQHFGNDKVKSIIIDDLDISSHKRMCEILYKSNIFKNIFVISRANTISTLRDVEESRRLFESDPVYLWPLGRNGIRELALQIFDFNDSRNAESSVDKTYYDLNALAIPLTPANCIMYLHILRREGDFIPLDRVSIIERYVYEALSRASDQTVSGFSVKDKIFLFSNFIYNMFENEKTNFRKGDWIEFCAAYQKDTLSEFDISALLNELKVSRVIVEFGGIFFVRFAFIYEFLVGSYVAGDPDRLTDFIVSKRHRMLGGVVEVISALTSDPLPLVRALQTELDQHLVEFYERYIDGAYDPLSHAEWKVQPGEDDEYWKAIGKQIDDGPANSDAIDEVKESLLSESRSSQQEVVIRKFEDLEVEIFRAANDLQDALRVAVGLKGDVKICALRSIFATQQIVLQVAAVFSRQLAITPYFQWGGLLFINKAYNPTYDVSGDTDGKLVPWVITSLDTNICVKLADAIGSRRLGATYKAAVDRFDNVTDFEVQLLFSLILRTKPDGWDVELEKIISRMDYKKWRQNGFVKLLLNDFRNELNSSGDRERIKHLVSFVEAKRSKGKAHPGSKLVSAMQSRLEDVGKFQAGEESGPP